MNGSDTRIEDHFADGEAFEETLTLATSKASSPFQHDFCADWQERWVKHGMRGFMSKRQADTLRAIAEMED